MSDLKILFELLIWILLYFLMLNEFGLGLRQFPTISEMSSNIFLPFCTTNLCKTGFSALTISKLKYRSIMKNKSVCCTLLCQILSCHLCQQAHPSHQCVDLLPTLVKCKTPCTQKNQKNKPLSHHLGTFNLHFIHQPIYPGQHANIQCERENGLQAGKEALG